MPIKGLLCSHCVNTQTGANKRIVGPLANAHGIGESSSAQTQPTLRSSHPFSRDISWTLDSCGQVRPGIHL
ncbi:hypothetical protein CERSUDRAFT_110128 [Gelatoporia subvermispora B]|uniref:Uncharacterized protein n=1 Tax=Ceriporiopsis subvermispora (strain B) TaxID=914234 RepID=M2PXH5_CERS8|nr:hypothetical protein CERSUDRAFT_110128 [Gelatoporia subvermispora B]